jgi:putative endonuclease
VDLVCRERGRRELVFVEVKTRSSVEYGAPQEAVDWEKRRRLVQAAQEWLEELDQPDVVARFDIVEVFRDVGGDSCGRVRHIENAFEAEGTRHPGSVPLIPGANRGDVLPRRGRGGAVRIRPRRARD